MYSRTADRMGIKDVFLNGIEMWLLIGFADWWASSPGIGNRLREDSIAQELKSVDCTVNLRVQTALRAARWCQEVKIVTLQS